ncbi:MAG: right-handed parallel beta-helix repeat-containing protein, partial [Verrucomicrobiae bacterium]|nr:right-handed parallel beta-helix repeat-containing protein [Verrucomicrobiae bacterium]
MNKRRLIPLGSFLFLSLIRPIVAAPSGGPYGPLQLEYAIPAGARTVYFLAPDGDSDAKGATLEKPTTLESAITRVVTGDAIILRGGVYRTGDLVFNQGITIQPYQDEQPVLKGTRIATGWEALSGGLWRTKWDTLFPLPPAPWWRLHRHIHDTPLYLFNNDMVFIDGRLLKTKGYPAELDENSYCIDYENGYVYVRTDPTDRLVEITAYDNAFTRTTDPVHGRQSDKKGFTMRGIILTQYAYRALEIEGYTPEQVSLESAHGKDVVGTVIEHCTMSYCSRVGAYLRGDNLVVRHCLVSDTGTEGLFILSSNDVLLEKNLITRNNEEGIQGYYATAVKIWNQCYRVTCNDNLVIDINNSSGIWYDVGNVDGVFTNNWIQNTTDGFFFEISKGVICTGNVFVNCVRGTRVLNSSNAKVYQNTYVNSGAAFERTPRSAVGDHFDWHPASGPDVDERHGHEFGNNLIVVHKD